MTNVVLDASAILAALLGERGGDTVEPYLVDGLVSALNYSEVIGRAARLCGSLDDAKRRIDRHSMTVIPFDADQAVITASLFPATKKLGLSLADRACLSLAMSRRVPVYTADSKWRELDLGVTIELIR